MKSRYYFLLLVLTVFCLSENALAQNIQEQLIGTWVFNYETSLELMNTKAKLHYDKMDVTRQEKVQQAYQNRKVIFLVDGSFSQELNNGRKAKGNWAIEKENNIIVYRPNGHAVSFKIKNIDDNTLILVPKKSDEKNANMLFSQWYLIKG